MTDNERVLLLAQARYTIAQHEAHMFLTLYQQHEQAGGLTIELDRVLGEHQVRVSNACQQLREALAAVESEQA